MVPMGLPFCVERAFLDHLLSTDKGIPEMLGEIASLWRKRGYRNVIKESQTKFKGGIKYFMIMNSTSVITITQIIRTNCKFLNTQQF